MEEVKTVTLEEFEKLQATNARILAEHKDDKAKYGRKLGEFEESERKKLAESKDYKTISEQFSAKIKDLESDLSDSQYKAFEKNLALEVGKLAKDAHSPTQILRALNITEDNTDLSNETLSDLSTQLDNLRKDEPNLFSKVDTSQTRTLPRYMKNDSKDKTIGEMSVKELEQRIKDRAKNR